MTSSMGKDRIDKGSSSSSCLECVGTLYPGASSISSSSDWNGSGGKEDQFYDGTIVWHCTWSHDGNYLAVSIGNQVCIYSVITTISSNSNNDNVSFSCIDTLTGGHERTIRYMEFAPSMIMNDNEDLQYILATASFDGTVAIWESSGGGRNHNDLVWELTAQLEGHESEVKCVTWNSTGTLLASCGRDKTIWIWECFLSGSIGAADYDDNDEEGGGDFECLAVLSSGHEGDIKHVEFGPSHGQLGDGDDILVSSSYDNTIRCWAEDDGDWYCAAILDKSVHTDTIWSFSIASGIRMVSASADGSLAIWRFYTSHERNNTQFITTTNHETTTNNNSDGLWKCVGRLPDAHNYNASAAVVTNEKENDKEEEDESLLLFPVSTTQPIYSVHCAPARAGHGRVASSCGDNSIQIYREVLGGTADRPLFVVDVHIPNAHNNDADINCIRWHPQNGKLLATAGDDGAVKIWNYTP